MRTFTSLKDVLPLALGKVAAGTTSAGPLKAVWAEVVGTAVANNAAPVSLVGGTLIVEVRTAQWAAELGQTAPDVLARLQAKVGAVVRSLRFEVKR